MQNERSQQLCDLQVDPDAGARHALLGDGSSSRGWPVKESQLLGFSCEAGRRAGFAGRRLEPGRPQPESRRQLQRRVFLKLAGMMQM